VRVRAKQGDLDLRFTPSPTALEGIATATPRWRRAALPPMKRKSA